MISSAFLIQNLDTGLYAAPHGLSAPFISDPAQAAAHGLVDAIQRIDELVALTGNRFRLVASELEWDFDQSVDFSPH